MFKSFFALAILSANYVLCSNCFSSDPFGLESHFAIPEQKKSQSIGARVLNYVLSFGFKPAPPKQETFSVPGARSVACYNGLLCSVVNVEPLVGIYGERFVSRVIIPRELKKISSETFTNQYTLQNVAFEAISKLEGIERAAFSLCHLQSICIPASVQTISNDAFSSNISLQNVIFEKGSALRLIKPYTFSSCDLISIVIPSSVEKIDFGAFTVNDNLRSITFLPGNTPITIENGAFSKTLLRTLLTSTPTRVLRIRAKAFI
jgi:hypothetical protein